MAKKIKKYKVGTDSETYAISMVEMPAIEEDFVALAKQKEQQVFLQSDEKHMVYGAVLVPDKDIYRNDGEKEYYITFTKESIERMSQDFMKEYRQHEVTLDHEDIANEVCVVESWIKSDLYKDKSVALGLNEQLPIGTWFAGMKVNNIETWERIKNGELKGFSVESMISLEEFSKNDNNMIETNDEMFWSKLKNVMKEIFTSNKSEADIETSEGWQITPESALKELEKFEIREDWQKPYPLSALTDPQNIELANASGFTSMESYLDEVYTIKAEFEEQGEQAAEPQPTEEAPKVEEPAVEEPKPQEEEPKVEEKPQEPNPQIEELIKSLKDEINALKEMNTSLNDKVKEMSKEPSAKPVNTNAKPNTADTYSAWRETMRSMIG